jgi:hypothetical protein
LAKFRAATVMERSSKFHRLTAKLFLIFQFSILNFQFF